MAARERAVHLLKHYLGLLAKRTGGPLESDTFIEIEDIVDAILEAADDQSCERIRTVENRLDSHITGKVVR